jgi:uncharacterized protein (DUF924 family)
MGKDMNFQEVLDFWFGAPDAPDHGAPRKQWFVKDPAFDLQVRQRFLELHASALAGELEQWQGATTSLLALILVLDQFPRNMFRGQAASFASDAAALRYARRMVERGWDAELIPAMRGFVYMPFEHSENLAVQKASLKLFEALAEDSRFRDLQEWAQKHYDIIRRFGRFPHRNAILGRESTAEEIEFLKHSGSGF